MQRPEDADPAVVVGQVASLNEPLNCFVHQRVVDCDGEPRPHAVGALVPMPVRLDVVDVAPDDRPVAIPEIERRVDEDPAERHALELGGADVVHVEVGDVFKISPVVLLDLDGGVVTLVHIGDPLDDPEARLVDEAVAIPTTEPVVVGQLGECLRTDRSVVELSPELPDVVGILCNRHECPPD